MKKGKDIELLNMADKSGLLPILLAELISFDTLVTENACNKSLEMISGFLEVIDETEIKDKDNWKSMLMEGVMIVKRDKERLLKENAPNK